MSLNLKNKNILITGGTGSFGSTFLNKIYLNKSFKEKLNVKDNFSF